jgi:hypothetical protein
VASTSVAILPGLLYLLFHPPGTVSHMHWEVPEAHTSQLGLSYETQCPLLVVKVFFLVDCWWSILIHGNYWVACDFIHAQWMLWFCWMLPSHGNRCGRDLRKPSSKTSNVGIQVLRGRSLEQPADGLCEMEHAWCQLEYWEPTERHLSSPENRRAE